MPELPSGCWLGPLHKPDGKSKGVKVCLRDDGGDGDLTGIQVSVTMRDEFPDEFSEIEALLGGAIKGLEAMANAKS